MFTEIAKGVAGGFAELVGVKLERDIAAEGGEPEPGGQSPAPEPTARSVSGAVAAEVEVILETAQESAVRIVADAREEAARIVAEARREAAVIADETRRSAAVAAPEEAALIETEETDVVVPPSVATVPEQPSVVEAPAEEGEEAAADGTPGTPETPDTSDAPDEGAVRLVAMNLAMGDASRAEIKAGIEAELGPVPGIEAILDDVLSRVG